MENMLSKALREFISGPLNQLIVNLAGLNSMVWEKEFKKFLRQEPCWIQLGYELHVPQTPDRLTGRELMRQILRDRNYIGRCFRKEDPLVQGWIDRPATYPQHLKDRMVLLVHEDACLYYYPYLIWGTDKVLVFDDWTESSDLRSSSAGPLPGLLVKPT